LLNFGLLNIACSHVEEPNVEQIAQVNVEQLDAKFVSCLVLSKQQNSNHDLLPTNCSTPNNVEGFDIDCYALAWNPYRGLAGAWGAHDRAGACSKAALSAGPLN